MKFINRDKGIFSIFAILVVGFQVFKWEFDPLLLVVFMAIGLGMAILASEKAVGGMEILGRKLGLTPYVSGVLSSLASNTPELVIGGFSILAGQVEFAIAFIIIATGFNILMLGILVILGNLRREKSIVIPEEVLEIEVPIVRVAIVIVGSIFVYGIVLFGLEIFGLAAGEELPVPHLPYEAAAIMVIVYLFYLYFILRHNLKNKVQRLEQKDEAHHEPVISRNFLIIVLVVAFAAIFFAGEMISSSVELFLEQSHEVGITLNEFQLAFVIGAAASIPEHAIALLAVRHEGGVELGLGNLIAGSMQNLLLMTGLVALFSYIAYLLGIARDANSPHGIPLVHYLGEIPGEIPMPFLLVQYGFAWLLLFLIKSSMTDDRRLDIYEGFTITVAQLFVFIIFLRGILGL